MPFTLESEYDVVIVGGGMVGASLACALEKAPSSIHLKVLLVEALSINLDNVPLQPSFDSRSTVLSYGSVEYFQQLDLWSELKEYAEPIEKIHVSDQGKFGAARIERESLQVEALGYVVENKAFGYFLNKAMQAAKRVEVCSSAKVLNISNEEKLANLLLEQDNQTTEVRAKLVVLAEGGRSGLCEKIGIYRSGKSYQQSAIICNVTFSSKHKNIAYERFTQKGPLALLPLASIDGLNRAALIWTHKSNEADEIMSLTDKSFLQKLQEDFGCRLGEFLQAGKRVCYPISLQKSEEQCRPNLVLLGNVAHALHPVAGQGFNLAMRDTMRLAEVVVQSVQRGENPGEVKNLQAYCEKVSGDQAKTIGFSHHMTNLFSNNNEVLAWARKFGLLSVDLIPPVKKAFARQAMGVSEKMVSLQ